MGERWTPERKLAASLKAKARYAALTAAREGRPLPEPVEPVGVVPPIPEIKVEPAPLKQKPVNLFSGFRKRFEIMGKNGSFTDPIPGYVLRAFLDVDTRISDALSSGWLFVDKDEVVLNDSWNTPLNTDLGSHIRIPANQSNAKGDPVYHYVMKQTKEWFEQNQQERETMVHQPIDQAIRSGTFNMTAGERRYTAESPPVGSPSGLPPISITSKLSR